MQTYQDPREERITDVDRSIRLALIELRGTVVAERLARKRIDAAIRLLEACL